MAEKSPFRVFWDWVFDGKKDTELPNKEIFLKYSSPISGYFLLKSFSSIQRLTPYLNEYFNNYYINALDKMELYSFIKKMVQDYKIQRYDK